MPFDSTTQAKSDMIVDIVRLVPALFGAGVTLAQISTVVTIFVGLATLIYMLVQTVVLLRKWWLLEKARKVPTWE